MTLSCSYVAPLTNFKFSYKDAYKKEPPLRSGEPPSYRFASTPLAARIAWWVCSGSYRFMDINVPSNGTAATSQTHLKYGSAMLVPVNKSINL